MSQSPVIATQTPSLPEYLSGSLAKCIDSGGLVVQISLDRPDTSAWVQTTMKNGSGATAATKGRPFIINHHTEHGTFRVTVETL